jgi:hypothetical protein
MYSPLLPLLSFHLRRLFDSQPYVFAALALSLGTFMLALFTWLSLIEAGNDAEKTLRAMKPNPATVMPDGPIATDAGESLRPFNSVEMVAALNAVASRTEIALNELTFTLDEGKARPYMRYRASMTVVSNYLAVRRFVDQINADIPDVSLDSISCGRKGIDDLAVKCDLVFTAFFKKDDRG